VIASGRELVTRLLEVTPASVDEAEAEPLLAAFQAVLAARDAILADVDAPITLSDADRPLLVELERRQALWHDALAAALRRVGEQRCGAAQVRAYAGPR
jgi:hypothetical protein